jgi:hypothetical protein
VGEAGPGESLTLRGNAGARTRVRIALRSPVPVEHLELVRNGEVVRSYELSGDRRSLDANEELELGDSPGWLLLRAWNAAADPWVLDLYPYATTNPVWLEAEGPQPAMTPQAEDDAAYFVAWLDRVIAATEARDEDWNDAREREATLEYLERAREAYRRLQASGRSAALTTTDEGAR